MKERPILFSAPMVRAILDGRKTQTRRMVSRATLFGDKTQDRDGYRPTILGPNNVGNIKWQWAKGAYFASHPHLLPYGQPGDRLWVKETARPIRAWQGSINGCEIEYRADGFTKIFPEIWAVPKKVTPWTPSIFMRRELSRITLEVTGVRVERLQDISADDCLAEGAVQFTAPGVGDLMDQGVVKDPWMYRQKYQWLWQDINGPGSWDANPWVWVVEFKRVHS